MANGWYILRMKHAWILTCHATPEKGHLPVPRPATRAVVRQYDRLLQWKCRHNSGKSYLTPVVGGYELAFLTSNVSNSWKSGAALFSWLFNDIPNLQNFKRDQETFIHLCTKRCTVRPLLNSSMADNSVLVFSVSDLAKQRKFGEFSYRYVIHGYSHLPRINQLTIKWW